MYLEYSPISCWFFSPQLAFAPEAFVHLYAAAKNVLFGVQSNKKIGPFGDPASFWCWHQTPREKHTYLFVWKHERIFMEKIWESDGFVWKMWWMFKEKWKTYMGKWWIWLKKWKNIYIHIYGKNMEKWRNCMETWRIYKEKWRISMEKWRIRLEKWKNLYGPTVF